MNGTYGPAAEKVRAFAESLRAVVPCEVKMWDERLTSVAAQRSLHEAGRTVKNSREVIDQVAAQMILQGWLDSQAMLG
jgi:putative Holliday junction resolvase